MTHEATSGQEPSPDSGGADVDSAESPESNAKSDSAKATKGGWRNNFFLRSVAVLMTGTVLAQVISVGSTPIISRIFAPEDFGVLAVINSVSGAIVGIASLRFDMAILVPKEERDASDVFGLACLACLLTTTVSLAAMISFRETIAGWVDAPEMADWLFVVPVIVLSTGLYQVLKYWCIRRKEFGRSSISAVIAALASGLGKIGGGLAGWGAPGLVLGQVGGQIIAVVALGYQVLRDDLARFREHITWAGIQRQVSEQREFPQFQAPVTFAANFSGNMPVYVIGFFFTTKEVGYWGMTLLALTAPVFVVSNAVRQVFMQRASELLHKRQDLTPLLIKATGILSAIAIPPAILGMFIAPWLFAAVLGDEWRTAGEYAQLLIPWQTSFLIMVPAVAAYPLIKLQKHAFVWQLLALGAAAAALAWGGRAGEVSLALGAYSAVMVVMNIAMILMVLWRARTFRLPEEPEPEVPENFPIMDSDDEEP